MSVDEQILLKTNNLNKTFKKKILWTTEEINAVNGVTFSIPQGSVFGLVGESGCGKTTTARCIAGLEEPSSGKIWFRDVELSSLKPREFAPFRKKLQMVFQDPTDSLNPRMTVERTIQEPLQIHTSLSNKAIREKILATLELVGLRSEHRQRYPHQLSTGQQQRVGVARAIICEPEFVILDEPTASLDISVRGKILELLLSLQERFHMTYMLISHDLGTVNFICKQTAVMYLGLIIETGKTRELFDKPFHPYTKTLIASIPRLRNGKKRSRTIVKGEVPSPIHLPSGCLFHTRCPEVMPICRRERPQLIEISEHRYVACHLVEQMQQRRD
jgi:oligopeptide/dipeptide ABC transporter ATP-binding protein